MSFWQHIKADTDLRALVKMFGAYGVVMLAAWVTDVPTEDMPFFIVGSLTLFIVFKLYQAEYARNVRTVS